MKFLEKQQLQVLHISDLHISDDEDFDQSLVLVPLINRVKEDRKKGIVPEIVVVTGDITYKGIEKEYESAKKFLNDLLKSLGLGKDRISLCRAIMM